MTVTMRACWTLVLGLLLGGCNGEEEVPAKKRISAGDLFLEYQVWGDEARGQVNVLLQLRQKNNKGQTVRLQPPGFVELDGEVLPPDSSRMTGIFYETQKPLEAFAGPHTITLKDEMGKPVSETFSYTPFTLTTPLQGRVGRDALVLQLAGLKGDDQLRVTLVDTVFRTQDINEVMRVVDGRLHIPREQLKGVTTGPVTLLLFKEEDRPIDNPGLRGGKMTVTYGVMREFDLAQ